LWKPYVLQQNDGMLYIYIYIHTHTHITCGGYGMATTRQVFSIQRGGNSVDETDEY